MGQSRLFAISKEVGVRGEIRRVLRYCLVLSLFLANCTPVVKPIGFPLDTYKRDMFATENFPLIPADGEVTSGESSRCWIPFDAEASPKSPQVKVLKSDEDSCVITVTVYGMYLERVEMEGEALDELTIPGCGFTSESGQPRLPMIRGMLEVPPGKKVGVTRVVHHEELSRPFICLCQGSTFECVEEAD